MKRQFFSILLIALMLGALAFSAALNAPIPETKFGIFRM